MTLRSKNPLERPETVRIAPLRWRRFWVLLSLLGYVAAFVSALLEQAALAGSGLALVILCTTGAALSVSNLFDRRDKVLDERLRTTRDAIYRQSYRVVTLLASVYISLLFWWPGLPRLEEGFQTLLMLAAFFFFLGLPTLLLAWPEKEPLESNWLEDQT